MSTLNLCVVNFEICVCVQLLHELYSFYFFRCFYSIPISAFLSFFSLFFSTVCIFVDIIAVISWMLFGEHKNLKHTRFICWSLLLTSAFPSCSAPNRPYHISWNMISGAIRVRERERGGREREKKSWIFAPLRTIVGNLNFEGVFVYVYVWRALYPTTFYRKSIFWWILFCCCYRFLFFYSFHLWR